MVSFCALDQHNADGDQLPFPSPNEVKIKFVLASKEKWLISQNVCQNILCSTDQRNTYSMQTCSTSKKECLPGTEPLLIFLYCQLTIIPHVNWDPYKIILPSYSPYFYLFATGTMYANNSNLQWMYKSSTKSWHCPSYLRHSYFLLPSLWNVLMLTNSFHKIKPQLYVFLNIPDGQEHYLKLNLKYSNSSLG